jgi:hypothetical protein
MIVEVEVSEAIHELYIIRSAVIHTFTNYSTRKSERLR